MAKQRVTARHSASRATVTSKIVVMCVRAIQYSWGSRTTRLLRAACCVQRSGFTFRHFNRFSGLQQHRSSQHFQLAASLSLRPQHTAVSTLMRTEILWPQLAKASTRMPTGDPISEFVHPLHPRTEA